MDFIWTGGGGLYLEIEFWISIRMKDSLELSVLSGEFYRFL